MQGAPHTARLKKNDGTTMACGGHWHTTPAQVKTEKTARHLKAAYFHERRSLNNFHRDRVITFEQIAE
ncbi:hypothetical protein ACK27_17550 [Salmonella enterica subsp. enterica serovar Kentucky]|nr:hypothetical protein [Salmonella enterica subsp. enterica serovar Heidelberg]EBN0436638.1 hypothetical protein [Salmonella enterica subsp. enterica serovar Kentucky]